LDVVNDQKIEMSSFASPVRLINQALDIELADSIDKNRELCEPVVGFEDCLILPSGKAARKNTPDRD